MRLFISALALSLAACSGPCHCIPNPGHTAAAASKATTRVVTLTIVDNSSSELHVKVLPFNGCSQGGLQPALSSVVPKHSEILSGTFDEYCPGNVVHVKPLPYGDTCNLMVVGATGEITWLGGSHPAYCALTNDTAAGAVLTVTNPTGRAK